MEEKPAIHLTIKWPSWEGNPERMINVYAETAADLQALSLELMGICGIALSSYFAAGNVAPREIGGPGQQHAGARNSPIAATESPRAVLPPEQIAEVWRSDREPFRDEGGEEPRRPRKISLPRCPKHGTGMEHHKFAARGKQFEQIECREQDDDELAGWCRMVADDLGNVRRKQTAAEREADRRTG